MKKYITLIIFTVLLSCPMLFAQEQPLTPEQIEKKTREAIDLAVTQYEKDLNLEIWQTFYVDSILTHNIEARNKEIEALANNKVENSSLYSMIVDKWEEETYNAFHAILNEEQWNKYLKKGAANSKKGRDKRAAKREGKK